MKIYFNLPTSVISKGASHINYLDEKNVIAFIKLVFDHVNDSAVMRDDIGCDDMGDEDAFEHLGRRFICGYSTFIGDVAHVHFGPLPEHHITVPDSVALFGGNNVRTEMDAKLTKMTSCELFQ